MKHFNVAVAILLVAFALPAFAQIQITNTTDYNTADQMLLANEINESGEPYAEAVGYDLDMLDPMEPDFPTREAYVLGVENYEYSRYQLGTVVSRSGIGLHMMWSPVITQMAAMQGPEFDGSHTMGMINGYNEDDMLMMAIMHFGMNANQTPPMGAWPQFGEFVSGDPHYAQPVAPDFNMDFSTLRWDRGSMLQQLSPGAMGQSLMKQYLWAQDMLGGFHDENEDEVIPDGIVTPDGPDGMFDPDNGVYYGGDNLDGFIGQVLTAEAINKVKNLIENLAYDGDSLGGVNPMTYDPMNGLKYFPNRIAVTEEMVIDGLPPRVGAYEVVDERSDLFGQASLLWGTLSFKNMMDPDNSSDSAHLAYHSVFDGDPFPADMMSTGIPGPFDLMKGASKVIFQNLMAMHFNSEAGSFVDSVRPAASPGDKFGRDDEFKDGITTGLVHKGNRISAVSAAYTLVALDVFQEEFSGTPMAPMALDAITAQARFLMDHMADNDNRYASIVTIVGQGHGKSGAQTVEAQAAAVRGLYAAFSATGEADFLAAADAAYMALIENYYQESSEAFTTRLHQSKATYTPRVVALISGALREARLVGGHDEATGIYVGFWDRVVNEMQLAEGMATGETGGDSDFDGIPFIPEQPEGLAPVFAPEATMRLHNNDWHDRKLDRQSSRAVTILHQNDPNPFNPKTVIRFELPKSGAVDLSVYDVRGKLVQNLVRGDLGAGAHEANFQPENVASGLYYYVLNTEGEKQVGKMTLLK